MADFVFTLADAHSSKAAVAGSQGYDVKADLFASQLQSVFRAVGAVAEKQSGDAFFREELAAFYYRLGQSTYVKAFACVIGQSSDRSAVSCLSAHPRKVAVLNAWMKENRIGTFNWLFFLSLQIEVCI